MKIPCKALISTSAAFLISITYIENRLPADPRTDKGKQVTGLVNPKDGAELVLIPAGTFLMGTDSEKIDAIWKRFGWPDAWKQYVTDELPQHRVQVPEFWMYKYEVTVAQYRTFCQATGRTMPDAPPWGWKDDHPIVNVDWEDAVAYCHWAGVELPAESQWEYAARGGNTGLDGKPRYIFVWGNELPTGKGGYGNFADESLKQANNGGTIFNGYDDGFPDTAPVGRFKPNGFGLYDMAGNVWEWCADRLAAPKATEGGSKRVVRGGSWYNYPSLMRLAQRVCLSPDNKYRFLGFRCASHRAPGSR